MGGDPNELEPTPSPGGFFFFVFSFYIAIRAKQIDWCVIISTVFHSFIPPHSFFFSSTSLEVSVTWATRLENPQLFDDGYNPQSVGALHFFFFFALRFVLQQLTSIRHLITKHFFFVLIFRSYNLDVTTHPFFLSKWTWWNALQCYYCTMSNFGFKKKTIKRGEHKINLEAFLAVAGGDRNAIGRSLPM